jgi:hypothetical protein
VGGRGLSVRGFPDFLNDEEVGFGLDDPLDPLLFMPG